LNKIDPDRLYFYSSQWQKLEKEAENDINAGRVLIVPVYPCQHFYHIQTLFPGKLSAISTKLLLALARQ